MHRAVGSRVSHIYPEDLELDIFPSCAREALRDSPGRATSNLVLGLRGVLLVMGPARMRVAQRDNGTSNVATLSARRAGASRFGRWPLCRRTLCRPDVPERPGSAGGRLAGMRPRIEGGVGCDSNTCHVIARAVHAISTQIVQQLARTVHAIVHRNKNAVKTTATHSNPLVMIMHPSGSILHTHVVRLKRNCETRPRT